MTPFTIHFNRKVRFLYLLFSTFLAGGALAEEIQIEELTGTWHGPRSTLELDASKTFLISEKSGLLPIRLKGGWHLEDSNLFLQVNSGKIAGDSIAIAIDDEELTLPVKISRSDEGEIILILEDEALRKHSDVTSFPWEWEIVEVEDRPEPSGSGWFIRPPIFPYPRVSIRIVPGEDDTLSFRLRTSRNIFGIEQIDVWQPGDETPRWSAYPGDHARNMRFGYGESIGPSARQLIPEDPETPPAPLDRSQPFFVRLEVSYRLTFPPSLGNDPFFYAFEFTEDGRVIQIPPDRARALNR
jgi:hypothetical protein